MKTDNKDKSTIKIKEEEGMNVSKRVKGKVVCKAERISFKARQKVSLIEEWDEAVNDKPGLTYKAESEFCRLRLHKR